MMIVILNNKKQTEERFLHCAIYPNAGFYRSLLNCSASGKKRGGDYHVTRAPAHWVLRS